MGELLRLISDYENVELAWKEVLANDLADGELSRSGERFLDKAETELADISTALRQSTYQFSRLSSVWIPKPNSEKRELQIPSVRDRIVERSITQVLGPLVDPYFSPRSFAYRPGVSVTDALRQLVELRDSGYPFILKTDINDCFPNLDHELILQNMMRYVDDENVLDLVRQILSRTVYGNNQIPTCGISQGGPISPFLSNVILSQLDVALAMRGVICLRYSDDLAIPLKSPEDANRLTQILKEEVAKMGVDLGDDKTELMSFEEGFIFLGEEISSKYPELNSLERSSQPDKRTLMVAREGAVVRIAQGQVIVSQDKKDFLKVPVSSVARLVVYGAVGLSAGARSYAMGTGTPVVFCSRRGSYLGCLEASTGKSVPQLRQQLRLSVQPEWQIDLARHFVFGKLANQRALLLRYSRDEPHENLIVAIDRIRERMTSCARADSIEVLMGLEGSGADAYWSAFRTLLPEWCSFEGRRHSPPPDGVNAMLSFGYTLLTGEAVTALHASGLEPGIGVIHAEGNDKPSLALDMMEEFRPVITDSVVLNLLRREQITRKSFRSESGKDSVLLTHESRKIVLAAIEERMLQIFSYPATNKKVSYRRALYLQAQAVAKCVQSGHVKYQPIRWRL
jgi:CRISPR-associated protein Cas1